MSEQDPVKEVKGKGGEDDSPNPDEPTNIDEGSNAVVAESDPPKSNGKKKRRILIIGGSALVIAAITGLIYWLYARQYESTDDAYIDGDIVQVSPKVAAYVTKVYVKANQYVHKGDPLVDLDPESLQVNLEQSRAQLENAKSQKGLARANLQLVTVTTNAGQNQAISNVQTTKTNVEQTRIAAESKKRLIGQAKAAAKTAIANLAQARAQVPQAESNVHLAQVEYDRRLILFNNGDISKQSLDQQTNALQTAQSQLNAEQKAVLAAQSKVDEANAAAGAAEENYRQALAQVDVTRSQVDESQGRLQDANAAPQRIDVSESQVNSADAVIAAAEAAVHQAELELSYAKITAPEDGYITKKSVEEGQLVAIGTPLMAISQSDDIWVVANFKETQLEDMQIGQSVSIKIDAYPGKVV